MEYLNPITAYNGLQTLLQQGGNVLYVIMLLAFAMFSFIMERFAYYFTAHKGMTVALPGLFFSNFIERKGFRETARFADSLSIEQ